MASLEILVYSWAEFLAVDYVQQSLLERILVVGVSTGAQTLKCSPSTVLHCSSVWSKEPKKS